MSTRLAVSLLAAVLLCGCAGPKASTGEAASSPSGSPAAPAPVNAPVAAAGTPAGIPLDAAQRAELDATIAKAPAAVRTRLRYALASGEDGKPHLVVYDGGGLPPDGHHPGRAHEYIVFEVLNASRAVHYDPQQNALVEPIPPPPQRETTQTK